MDNDFSFYTMINAVYLYIVFSIGRHANLRVLSGIRYPKIRKYDSKRAGGSCSYQNFQTNNKNAF